MTGILTAVSSGVILAETCEAYANGWGLIRSNDGDCSLTGYAHSGAYSFYHRSGDTWPANAYVGLTKSVATLTGNLRRLRVFRGHIVNSPDVIIIPPWTMIDDFNGAYGDPPDPAIWQGGSSAVQQGDSTIHFPSLGYFRSIGTYGPYRTYEAQLNPPPHDGNRRSWMVADDGSGGQLVIVLFESDGRLRLHTNGTQDVYIECGNYTPGWHTYRVKWTSTYVRLYVDDVLLGTSNYPPSGARRTQIEVDAGYIQIRDNEADPVSEPTLLDNQYKLSLKIGSETVFDVDAKNDSGPLNNGMHDTGWYTPTSEGTQTFEMKLRNASATGVTNYARYVYWDDLILMADTRIKITGLLGGQKVELWSSGGVMQTSAVCPGTGQNTWLTGLDTLISTAYGYLGYFKVYDTDGVTLLYTTSTGARWGGDVYNWVPNQTNIDITTNVTLTYRTGSGLTPTTAIITATLTDKGTGAKLSGKTIQWTSYLGSCSPGSGSTDGNGQASTTFTTGSSAGLAGVEATFAGDATYGTSTGVQQVDIYYGTKTVDASKDFQIWLEGQEIPYSSGAYRVSADFRPQPFSMITPSLTVATGFWWAVEVYRRGIKEYQGRILIRNRRRSPNAQLTLTGSDETIMLQRRVANRAYIDEPQTIVLDLLSRYPCGITAGSISLYGSTINLPATYTNLFDALTQISAITGWKFRRNPNNTLDFAPTFGTTQPITVSTGENEAGAVYNEDATQLDTKVYVIGGGAAASLVSTASDPTSQMTYGLIEQPFLEKNITAQGTLDLRAQELLNQLKNVKETVTVDWIDDLPSGTYSPFDIVDAEDGELGISGAYIVNAIGRNLTDADLASLELTSRPMSLLDLLQTIKKNIQDLGVA